MTPGQVRQLAFLIRISLALLTQSDTLRAMNKKQCATRERVRALHVQGYSELSIMRQTGLHCDTIRNYLSESRAELREQAIQHRHEKAMEKDRECEQSRVERDARNEAKRLAKYNALLAQRKASRAAILKTDGERALLLIANGMKPRDVLLFIGGSRARLYRAMDVARETFDPLLL